MPQILKKSIFGLIFNSSLFFLLIIGIQNSSNKSKVNFFKNKTVDLPISFVIGTSFISGSLIGSLLTINLSKKINSSKRY